LDWNIKEGDFNRGHPQPQSLRLEGDGAKSRSNPAKIVPLTSLESLPSSVFSFLVVACLYS
jgi:hypothetical protein